MDKVFLDTNIIMDFLESSRSKHDASSIIVMKCLTGDIKGCISETVITNCSYLLRKTYNQRQLNEIFSKFCEFFEILALTKKGLQIACKVNIDDLEDAILYHIALENDCQFFITSNLPDFQSIAQPSLPIVSPETFLEWYKNKK